jgi:hypothetical protein
MDCGHHEKYYCTRCGGCYRCDHEVVQELKPVARKWRCKDGIIREAIQEDT